MPCTWIREAFRIAREDKTKACSVFAVVFLLCVLVIVVICVWTMPDIERTDGNTHICLQINDAVQCTETVSTLTELLQKEITEVYDRTVKQDTLETKRYFEENVHIELKNDYLATIPDMKPSAKLVGLITSNRQAMVKQNDTLDTMETVRDWFHDRELDYTTGFMRYGVRYQNGRLIVPLTGTYYIYSFLSLTENNDVANVPVQTTNRTMVKHAMYKYNVKLGKDIELASSLQTHRQSTKRNFNAFSSQISTLVQLEAGDEISVKISDISLTSNPSDNFFGLLMI